MTENGRDRLDLARPSPARPSLARLCLARLCLAVDEPSLDAAERLLDAVGGEVGWIKVGLELFAAEGPRAIDLGRRRGLRVFLDLKLHDIPATVARAVRAAAAQGVDLLTVHAAGGRAMLAAAVEAAHTANPALRVVAVTVLTSMDERDLGETGCRGPLDELVLRRAELAMEAGADGVVASAQEAAALREGAPAGFFLVTPGIRTAGSPAGDQKRVATAAEAIAAGADLLVIGRPIRDAADPRAAARAFAADIEGALSRQG